MVPDSNNAHPLYLESDVPGIYFFKYELGSEGYDSVTHNRDVDVGGQEYWRLVLTEGAMEGPGEQPDCCLLHIL